MANSADPDQKPTDLDLHCLQNRVYPGSAGQVNPSTNYFLNNLFNASLSQAMWRSSRQYLPSNIFKGSVYHVLIKHSIWIQYTYLSAISGIMKCKPFWWSENESIRLMLRELGKNFS